MNAHWEHFAHEADIGVRGYGADLAQALEQAALALTAVVTDPALVAAREAVEISVEAPDIELLLVDWLNGVVYEMATRKLLFRCYSVHTDGRSLHATAWGEPVDMARHQPAVEVKGATYTALDVHREPNGQWVAQCVVDV